MKSTKLHIETNGSVNFKFKATGVATVNSYDNISPYNQKELSSTSESDDLTLRAWKKTSENRKKTAQ